MTARRTSPICYRMYNPTASNLLTNFNSFNSQSFFILNSLANELDKSEIAEISILIISLKAFSCLFSHFLLVCRIAMEDFLYYNTAHLTPQNREGIFL